MADSRQEPPVTELVFYTTAGCHLCEQAADLLEELQQLRKIAVKPIDISTDAQLVELYGIRIPVVKNQATDKELGWPFQLDELISLV